MTVTDLNSEKIYILHILWNSLFLQCLSGTGLQIHLFSSGTGPESQRLTHPVLNFREYPPLLLGSHAIFLNISYAYRTSFTYKQPRWIPLFDDDS